MTEHAALWDLVGHAFNMVYLLAFMAKDRKRMRLLLMSAATLELFYFLHVAATPLWSGVIWSAAYVAYAAQGLLREHWDTVLRIRTDP
jgi:hypothetical protein